MAIQFTEAEKSSIMDITQSYSVMMKRSVELAKIIEDAEKALARMASDMDQLKQNEHEFFHGLATKYDVELRTVENAAANYAINPS